CRGKLGKKFRAGGVGKGSVNHSLLRSLQRRRGSVLRPVFCVCRRRTPHPAIRSSISMADAKAATADEAEVEEEGAEGAPEGGKKKFALPSMKVMIIGGAAFAV